MPSEYVLDSQPVRRGPDEIEVHPRPTGRMQARVVVDCPAEDDQPLDEVQRTEVVEPCWVARSLEDRCRPEVDDEPLRRGTHGQLLGGQEVIGEVVDADPFCLNRHGSSHLCRAPTGERGRHDDPEPGRVIGC